MVLHVSVVSPRDYMADQELGLPPSAQLHGRIVLHIASMGKDQNSKSEVWFLLNVYCFHTILKLKNLKSNDHKLGTVCT